MKHLFRAKSLNGEIVEGFLFHNDQIVTVKEYVSSCLGAKGSPGYDYTYHKVIPDSVVYIPNEELIKKWEKKNCVYDLPGGDEFDGVRRDLLEQCISELKEVGK